MRAFVAWLAVVVGMALSGCAEMLAVTPQVATQSGDKKVEVKSKVLVVSALAYAPNGKQLASAGVAPAIRVWDLANGRGERVLPVAAPYGIVGLTFSPDGKSLAGTGMTGLFGDSFTHLWEATSGKQIREVPGKFLGRLAFSADGRYLFGSEFNAGGLFGEPSYAVKAVDIETGETVRRHPGYMVGEVSADGRGLLLIGQGRRGVALVETKTGREVWRAGERSADAAAWTPDGRLVLTSHSEFQGAFAANATISVVLRDAASGNPIRELLRYGIRDLGLIERENYRLKVLLVSPDGKRFVTANDRGEYKLWDLASGQLVGQLKRPDEQIMFGMSPACAAFSPNGKLLAITSAGSVRLYDSSSGEEVAAMVAFDDGEWLMTTPSGYYNASEKGDEYLSVSVAGAQFSIAQLRESFYRPDLVKLALSGGTLSEFRSVADVRPPPTVAIVDAPSATNARRVGVVLRVKDQGGGIGDVRLYRNGAAVVLEKTRTLPAAVDARGFELRYDIPLEPGDNAIRAIAFNADNSMQSADATIAIRADIAVRQPAMHAIVIGIKDFANSRLALKYTVSDAELFASTLEARGPRLFSAVRVKRLVTPQDTTKAAIIEALKRAQEDVASDDLFVFYVASHGTVDDGQYLLITSNVGSTSTARLKQDALTQDTLKELISNIPASKKLIVLDTCSAGQLGDALQVAMLTRGMSDDTAMKVLSRAVGSTVLSAATSVQEALEGYEGHGLFTRVIVDGLNGAADADGDGYVKTLELADYVDNKVPELAERVFKHKQYPIVSPTGQGFPLVRTR